MKRVVTVLAFLMLGSFLVVGNSWALSISFDVDNDGTGVVTVDDGSGDDADAYDGMVTYAGALDGWIVSGIGTSAPLLGTDSEPELDLLSFSLSTTSGGTIAVSLTDTYGSYADVVDILGILASIGGTTTGTVDFYVDINGETASLSWDELYVDGESFAGALSVLFSDFSDSNDAFYMTIKVVITQEAGTLTTLDASLTPVPEPATMLLLGSGLLGLAAYRKKRLQK